MYQSYEKLEVWQKAVALSARIYELLRDCRDYGFKDQVCRASVSIASNIAEGMERESKKETVHFLHIAKGSCAEVRTQVLIASKINYISADDFEVVKNEAESISRMLHGLVKALCDKS
ncbi:four helix bundle protein [Tichowtungia aerotolerans]|uniref:Four helix bundle protein n=1 Tax=Tichowtungia aerotolerans TaxID=2697043 RepID=A0A6P1M6H2_9BACT|nr:four helix bundle protein [Tichowtungia aerotolerans]QHI70180.1 four helix bundle protein [Tichowtungia aerotolerans]